MSISRIEDLDEFEHFGAASRTGYA